MESSVPEETELWYSNTTALAFLGMEALKVSPSTNSAARKNFWQPEANSNEAMTVARRYFLFMMIWVLRVNIVLCL